MFRRLPVLPRIAFGVGNSAPFNRLIPNYAHATRTRLHNHAHLRSLSSTPTKTVRSRFSRSKRQSLELLDKPIEGLSQRRDDYFPASFARDPKPLSTETERGLDNKKRRPKKPREVSLVASCIRLFLKTHYNVDIPLNDQFHLVEMLKQRLHALFPAGDWETSMVKALIKLKVFEMCRLRVRGKFLELPDKPIEGLSQRRDDYLPVSFARDSKPLSTESERELDDKKGHPRRPREVSLVASFIRYFLKKHYSLEIPLNDQLHLVEMLKKRLHVVFPAGDWETSMVKSLIELDTIKLRTGIQRKLPKKRKMKQFGSTEGAPKQLDIVSRTGNVPVVFLGKPIQGLSERRDDYYPIGLARDPKPRVDDECKRRLTKTPELILVADCIRRFLKSQLYNVNLRLDDQYCVVEILRRKLQAVFPAGDWNLSIVNALLIEKKKQVQKAVPERKIQSFPKSDSVIREVPVPAGHTSVTLSDKPIEGLSQRRDDYYPANLTRDPKAQRELKKPRERMLVASYIRSFLQSEGYDFNMTPSQKLCVVETLKKKLQVVFPAGDWKTSPVKHRQFCLCNMHDLVLIALAVIRRKLASPKFRMICNQRAIQRKILSFPTSDSSKA